MNFDVLGYFQNNYEFHNTGYMDMLLLFVLKSWVSTLYPFL